ncbi:MAG: amidohydrolase family protein [Actinobacteria bacterium]|nr:amidohydrolase family protein [Actinomycetota bacterium]
MDSDRRVALNARRAYIGTALTAVDDAVIVVSDGTIEAAGPRSDVVIPREAHVIDASSRTILPGFIDAHVHIGLAEPRDVLRGGVTCVRDLAWPREAIYPLAARSRDPSFEGPLILTVGPMLTVDDGYPITAAWAPAGTGIALDSTDAAIRVVRELVAERVSAIKIALNPPAGRVLDDELLKTIVQEAHRLGTIVTAHVHGLDQLHRALDAGVDELAHMLMSPERLPGETIERMIVAGVVIVPTLSIFPPRDVGTAIENLARFIRAGGRVVYGTDLGNDGPGPGIDDREVARMGLAGMTAVDVVRSATIDSARWLGLQTKGHIARGMDADLIAIDAPIAATDDPQVLTRVGLVMRGGRVVAS